MNYLPVIKPPLRGNDKLPPGASQKEEQMDQSFEWMFSRTEERRDKLDWKRLPGSYEFSAVKDLAEEFKASLKGLIRGRIAVAESGTFKELLMAIEKASQEHDRRIARARK